MEPLEELSTFLKAIQTTSKEPTYLIIICSWLSKQYYLCVLVVLANLSKFAYIDAHQYRLTGCQISVIIRITNLLSVKERSWLL